jgi:hypothetical protein
VTVFNLSFLKRLGFIFSDNARQENGKAHRKGGFQGTKSTASLVIGKQARFGSEDLTIRCPDKALL